MLEVQAFKAGGGEDQGGVVWDGLGGRVDSAFVASCSIGVSWVRTGAGAGYL